MSHVLIITTSHDRLLDGGLTGLRLEEFALVYTGLVNAGCKVTVSSVAGGRVPIDPGSEPTAAQREEWRDAVSQLSDTVAFEEISWTPFHAVYIPGGHGAMFDMPFNKRLHELLYYFSDSGRIIAGISHGPAVFVGMRDASGVPFVGGLRVAGLSDAEEDPDLNHHRIPFRLETRLRALGADMQLLPGGSSHAVEDRLVITGQNPTSSRAVVELLLESLRRSS